MSKPDRPANAESGDGNRRGSALKFLRESSSTFIVLVVLGAIGYWGYLTEWKFRKPAREGSKSNQEEAKESDRTSDGAARVIPPVAPKKECPLAGTRIEFPSAEMVERAGIKTAPAAEKPMSLKLTAPGEVDYDPTHVARLSSAVPGRVWRVEKEVGQQVRKGEVLVLLDAIKVGEAKAEFLQSVTQLDLKVKTLDNLKAAGEGVAQRKVMEGEADARDVRIRLFNAEQALINLQLPIRAKDIEKLPEDQLVEKVRFLGLPQAIVETLDRDTATSNLFPILAPFDGIVAEREAAPGEVVDPTKILFVVADLKQIWILTNIRQEDRDKLALGQAISFMPDGHSGEVVHGKVSWISTIVDEKTRQLRARAVVSNPREHLPARTFGTTEIVVRDDPKAIVVPTEAIQRTDSCRFVFVRVSDRAFECRDIRTGVTSGETMEVLDGLKTGDIVATTGSFVLKSEVLKGRFNQETD